MRKMLLAICVVLSTAQAEAASSSGIVSQLKSQCNAKVIAGTVRRNVAGTNMISCHAMGQAVDVTGNYACIYRVLRNYPGGYTTDWQRCGHVHISWCKREWGLRFKHGSC